MGLEDDVDVCGFSVCDGFFGTDNGMLRWNKIFTLQLKHKPSNSSHHLLALVCVSMLSRLVVHDDQRQVEN
jgi:hypothetical protein